MSFNTTKVDTTGGAVDSKTEDGSGTPITSTLVSGKQGLDVNVVNTSLSASGVVDITPFTYGNGIEQTVGGVYQDTAPTVTAGNTGAARITEYRALHTNLRNASGTEIGTASTPVRTDPTGSTTQPVSGTVTANLGTIAGVATETTLSSLNTKVPSNLTVTSTRLLVDGSGVTQPVSGSVTATQTTGTNLHTVVDSGSVTLASGSNTVGVVDQGLGGSSAWKVDGSAVTQPVSGTFWQATQPVSGTVTANQGGSPWTQDITKWGGTSTTLGQKAMSASVPVVLPSDQASIPVSIPANVTVVGTKSNNDTLDANNVGVLPAVVSSLGQAYTNGKQGALSVDTNGFLRTSSRSENIIGDVMIDHRVNQIEVNFSQAFDTNLITNTVTNSGTATQANGTATYSTSTNANGTARGVSVQTVNYRAGSEIYAFFTAAFTTPTSANSFQRIGIYSDTDGFFMGYEGTSFKVTRRQNSVDTGVAQASFNGDLLNGSAGSAFTRQGVVEAIDWTKLNVFRIMFSWFGAAPIRFEVLSPDVTWVVFHTINYPNSATSPSIFNPNQPMGVHVSKTGADATNLSIITSCWAGGSSMDAVKVTDTITDYTLAPLTRSVITGRSTAGGGTYVNVKVNPSGALTVAASQDTSPWVVSGTVTANLGTIDGVASETTLSALNTKVPSNLTVTSTRLLVDGSGVTQPVSGTVTATIAAGASTIAKAEDAASADADVGVPAMAIRKATPANTSGTDGDYEMLQMSAGRLWVDPSGVTLTTQGVAAHDAAISGNPVRIGGRGVTADYTAVATGDTTDFITDVNGKQVVLLGSIPENFTSGVTAAITGTSDTSVIGAPGAGIRLYITQITVTNGHATVNTLVEIKDDTTVIYRVWAQATGGGAAITFPTPLRLTANKALQAACTTTGASVYVSAAGYKAP